MRDIHKIRKYILLSLIISSIVFLSGCAEHVSYFTDTTLPNELKQRFSENQKVLDGLRKSNFIDEATYKEKTKHISDLKDDYFTDDNKIEPSYTGTFVKAVSKYRLLSHLNVKTKVTDSSGKEITDNEDIDTRLNELAITNLIYANRETDSKLNRFTYPGIIWNDKTHNLYKTAQNNPIVIVKEDDDMIIDYQIYVLKPSLANIGNDTNIDTAIDLIQNSISLENTGSGHISESDFKVLEKYFEPAKYSKDTVINGKTKTKGSTVLVTDLLNISAISGISKEHTSVTENKPGVDLRISQNICGTNYDIMDIKFREFYSDEISKLNALAGIDTNSGQSTMKWATYVKGNTKIAFLLEYPVYYIAGLQDSKDDSNVSEAIIRKSDIGVNLYTGDMLAYSYDTSSGDINGYTKIVNKNNESYLILKGSGGSNSDSQSAFFMSGIANYNLSKTLGVNDTNVIVNTSRIILRDYLEATYAPDADESYQGNGLVVFGRKIRFTNIITKPIKFVSDVTPESEINYKNENSNKYIASEDSTGEQTKISFNKKDYCAKFVDKDGVILKGTQGLLVQDLCDYKDLTNSTVEDRKSVTVTAHGLAPSSGTATDKDSGDIKALPWENTGKFVETTVRFPSVTIGNVDYINDDSIIKANDPTSTLHQVFYAVATSTDLFQTDLFDSWINSDSDKASLSWWHTWLSNNNYKYALSNVTIEEFLKQNYAFELSQSGVIILDLETVHKIQEEMDDRKEAEANETFRTVFLLVGWALIIYAIILMLAWLLDTNIDLGVQLTNKLTFGHWVPVKYAEDIPNSDAEGRLYVTLGSVSIRCLIIVAVGITIILIDIMDILVFLIGMFGVFSQKLSEMLTGVR